MNPAFVASPRAQAAVSSAYGWYASVDLLQNGVVVAQDVPLDEDDTTAGVSVDGSASVRRQAQFTIADASTYLPLLPTGLLSPFITEAMIWTGCRYFDGTFDRWPIFVGEIEDPKITDDGGDLGLTVTASDRGQSIAERRLSYPYVIAAGVAVTNAIQSLVNSVRPGILFNVSTPAANPTLPASVIDQLEDPWQHAQDLANAYGMECFFNGAGTCVIQPIPDPNSQAPVWWFNEDENAMVLAVDAVLTAKDSYSHAICIGATVTGEAPVRADLYDTDPSSPTYYLSGFGNRPVELQSDYITTQDQASAAATALLARKQGAIQNVQFTAAPHTALDEHDVVFVRRARIGIDAAFMLDSFTIPLYPSGTMTPTCRSRQL